jgi:hypothetical protein
MAGTQEGTDMTLDEVVQYSMGFLLIAVVTVAAFLALDGLDDNLSASSYAANATSKINQGIYNSVEMAPTWGTLIGVSVLIAIVLGGLVVGYGFGKGKGYW